MAIRRARFPLAEAKGRGAALGEATAFGGVGRLGQGEARFLEKGDGGMRNGEVRRRHDVGEGEIAERAGRVLCGDGVVGGAIGVFRGGQIHRAARGGGVFFGAVGGAEGGAHAGNEAAEGRRHKQRGQQPIHGA